MSQRVGIYAGTFNPVHEGHLSFARQAAKAFKLNKVFFLVEPRPRRKQGVKALLHRQYMVHLAIAKEPGLGSIMLEQEQYSVAETMPILRARLAGAELYMLMGDDVLGHLASWPDIADLISSSRFVIGARRRPVSAIRKHIKLLTATRGLVLNYEILPVPQSELSSQRIRVALRAGQTPIGLAPTVLDYIQAQKLYSSTANE